MFWVVVAFAPAAAQPMQENRSVEPARQILSQWPGEAGFLFAEISDAGPQPLAGVNADSRFAVGSSFKLYILGALIDEVNAGRRRIDEVMLLRPELRGPPASELADWPAGSPVTLHTLALKMISISDNTATDHLHYLLGRERIERQIQVMGHARPELNRPLLSTREMTLLRDRTTNLPGREYAKLDERGRRAFLAEKFRGVPDFDKLISTPQRTSWPNGMPRPSRCRGHSPGFTGRLSRRSQPPRCAPS